MNVGHVSDESGGVVIHVQYMILL